MKNLLLIAALSLTGCATCNRYPVECGAAVGVVATSIALSINHSSISQERRAFYQLKELPR